MADPDVTDDEKLNVATRLFGALEETLDSSSLKLRSQAGNPEQLVKDRGTQLFLFAAVNKIGVASSFAERLFAKYNLWTKRSVKPVCPAHLAAKHVTYEFKSAGLRQKDRYAGFSSTTSRGKKSEPSHRGQVGC